LLLILLILCFIKRSKGGKYSGNLENVQARVRQLKIEGKKHLPKNPNLAVA
jgi:hypothetical protein